MLAKRLNKETGKKEYCLISKSTGKVLEWFGPKPPSESKFKEAERRVQYFKHVKG